MFIDIPHLEQLDKNEPLQHIVRADDNGYSIGVASIYDLRHIKYDIKDTVFNTFDSYFDYLQTWAESKSNDLLILVQLMMKNIDELDLAYLSKPKILLELLMVNKEYRNQGIARKLMDYVHKYFNCDMYGFLGDPIDGVSTENLYKIYTKIGCELIPIENKYLIFRTGSDCD